MSGSVYPALGAEDVLRLTDELHRIASRIRDAVPSRYGKLPNRRRHEGPVQLLLAETLLAVRRRIDHHFAAGLFADPGRDLLLDLYASALRGQKISVSSACIAAAVPTTTALRWIKRLEAAGLAETEADTVDNRRVFVRLSETAMHGMEAYMADVAILLSGRD